MGTGCDDLIANLSKESKAKHRNFNLSVGVLEADKKYIWRYIK